MFHVVHAIKQVVLLCGMHTLKYCIFLIYYLGCILTYRVRVKKKHIYIYINNYIIGVCVCAPDTCKILCLIYYDEHIY